MLFAVANVDDAFMMFEKKKKKIVANILHATHNRCDQIT